MAGNRQARQKVLCCTCWGNDVTFCGMEWPGMKILSTASACVCVTLCVCLTHSSGTDCLSNFWAQLMQHATVHCITPQRIANHWNKRQTQSIYDNKFMSHIRSMCVCVCECVWERERKRTREIDRKRESYRRLPNRNKLCHTRLSLFQSALLWTGLFYKLAREIAPFFPGKKFPQTSV